MMKLFLETYTFNRPLDEALDDPELSTTRRMLAGAAMPLGLDSAYYLTAELLGAFELLVQDRRDGVAEGRGAARLAELLAADGCDYQRRIYYIVSELELYEALGDLSWLAQTTRARAGMFRLMREVGAPIPPIPGAGRDMSDAGDGVRSSRR